MTWPKVGGAYWELLKQESESNTAATIGAAGFGIMECRPAVSTAAYADRSIASGGLRNEY